MLLITIIIILLFRKAIKKLFGDYDYHTLFRSFFCLFISTLSMGTSLWNWNLLLTNPMGKNYISSIINNLMLSYMIVDTSYFLYKKNFRIELMAHHLVCLFAYGFYTDTCILSFCSINEILSSFNWIGIIYPNLEWVSKLFRLYSILFIRLFIWIFTLVFLHKLNLIYQFARVIVVFFICLDIYWSWIILSNFFKFSSWDKYRHQNRILRLISNFISPHITQKNKN